MTKFVNLKMHSRNWTLKTKYDRAFQACRFNLINPFRGIETFIPKRKDAVKGFNLINPFRGIETNVDTIKFENIDSFQFN